MIKKLHLKNFDPSQCLIALGLRWIYVGLNILDVSTYICMYVVIYFLFNFLCCHVMLHYITTSPPYWVVEYLTNK
jgi:hypothetical protein